MFNISNKYKHADQISMIIQSLDIENMLVGSGQYNTILIINNHRPHTGWDTRNVFASPKSLILQILVQMRR